MDLCGVQWHSILEIEASRMANPRNQYWVVAAHQYITASLNRLTSGTNNTEIDATLLWLGDSLERACHNLSTWTMSPTAYTMIETLRHYNNACGEAEQSGNTTIEALYYIYAADTLVIPLNESLGANKTLVYSLLEDEYRFRQFTTGGSAIALAGIPILVCIIIVLMNKRRKYHALKRRAKNPPIQIGTRNTQVI